MYFFFVAFILFSIQNKGYGKNIDTITVNQLIFKAFELENTYPDSAYILAQKILKISELNNYQKGIASACMRLGSVLNKQGKNDSALYFIRKAYEIRKELKNYHGAIGACYTMCYIYVQTGKIDSAFAILYDALNLNKLSNDSSDWANIYIELGNLSAEYNVKDAMKYFSYANVIAAKLLNEELSLRVFSGIATYYFKVKNYKQSLLHFLKAYSIIVKRNDDIALAKSYNNIALCYDQLHEYPKATLYYHKYLNQVIKLGLRNNEAQACFNLASMYNNRKMPDSAIFYLNKSLDIAQQTNDRKRKADCYEYLSDAYALKLDFKTAYEYHLKTTELNDSLLNADKISSISEMQTKYETEKKEAQIVLLGEQNKTRSLQRNFFIAGTGLFLLLAGAIFIGLMRTSNEKKKSESLLLNILPSEVADELKHTGISKPRQYNNVTVLFTDFVNFTGISSHMSADELVAEINKNFTAFDAIMGKHGLEKIKTIGDSYMAVCGLPIEVPDHAQRVIKAALDIQSFIAQSEGRFEIRIGVHTGPVVAGIVGVKKFAYDIWGDTVNTASRMESNSQPGKINISKTTFDLVKNEFNCIHRGKISAKHKGEMDMYFVEG